MYSSVEGLLIIRISLDPKTTLIETYQPGVQLPWCMRICITNSKMRNVSWLEWYSKYGFQFYTFHFIFQCMFRASVGIQIALLITFRKDITSCLCRTCPSFIQFFVTNIFDFISLRVSCDVFRGLSKDFE